MMTHSRAFACCLALTMLPAAARPEDDGPEDYDPDDSSTTVAQVDDAQMADELAPVRPESGPPGFAPQPLPSRPALPPRAQQPAPAAPAGQWVYTQQYGWIWMPYADAYTSVPPGDDGEPYQYVYTPYYGWTWVVAPWIWGWGPWPYFGVHSPWHFGWYGHGWWRTPGRWHHQPGFRGGGVWRGPPGGSFGHRGAAAWSPGRAVRGGFVGHPTGGRPGTSHSGGGHPGARSGGGHGRR